MNGFGVFSGCLWSSVGGCLLNSERILQIKCARISDDDARVTTPMVGRGGRFWGIGVGGSVFSSLQILPLLEHQNTIKKRPLSFACKERSGQ